MGMTIESVIARIGEIGIIHVVRAPSINEAIRAVEAVTAGGIPVAEITMTVPNAMSVIQQVLREFKTSLLVGAGTITTGDQAKGAIDAGAQFIVSPGLSIPVVSTAQACNILSIPGALTPTELMIARQNGAKLVKIFPCGNVGGPKYLRSLKVPFPDAHLIPTGGVNVSNAAEFIAAGAFALGIGADLVSATALRDGNSAKITETARELVHAVVSAREAVFNRATH
jgi:2-dehydro-3-deoxyphosphogluconate aldolase/(4S)-4-hydroxy-2-oxoglutarate aldolase